MKRTLWPLLSVGLWGLSCALGPAPKAPPAEVQDMVDRVRFPRKAFEEPEQD